MKTQKDFIEDKIHFAQWIIFNMWKLLPDGNWVNEVMTQYDIVSSERLHEIYVDSFSDSINIANKNTDDDDFEDEFELAYISKLRYAFAGQAMNGIISYHGKGLSGDYSSLSETAYSIADEMLKHRKNK